MRIASHGAWRLSVSRVLAQASVGAQRRGGATSTLRGSPGRSAVITAVSARNRCLVINCAVWSPTSRASRSDTPLSTTQARGPSGRSGNAATASGVYGALPRTGRLRSETTTAVTPDASNAVRVSVSSRPSAGQAGSALGAEPSSRSASCCARTVPSTTLCVVPARRTATRSGSAYGSSVAPPGPEAATRPDRSRSQRSSSSPAAAARVSASSTQSTGVPARAWAPPTRAKMSSRPPGATASASASGACPGSPNSGHSQVSGVAATEAGSGVQTIVVRVSPKRSRAPSRSVARTSTDTT